MRSVPGETQRLDALPDEGSSRLGSPRALRRAGAWARARGVQLGLIVLVGAVLRFWGILHGLREGYIYHPDAALEDAEQCVCCS